MNSNPSQAIKILQRLKAAREFDGWVPMPILSDVSGAYAVHSRIAELRKRGYVIENKPGRAQDGTRMSWYRLVSEEREAA